MQRKPELRNPTFTRQALLTARFVQEDWTPEQVSAMTGTPVQQVVPILNQIRRQLEREPMNDLKPCETVILDFIVRGPPEAAKMNTKDIRRAFGKDQVAFVQHQMRQLAKKGVIEPTRKPKRTTS